jgi:hypothetical protein
MSGFEGQEVRAGWTNLIIKRCKVNGHRPSIAVGQNHSKAGQIITLLVLIETHVFNKIKMKISKISIKIQ